MIFFSVIINFKVLIQTKESWKVQKGNYNAGKVTYIDLQQTYNNYLQTLNNQIQARYSFYTEQFALLNAIRNLYSY